MIHETYVIIKCAIKIKIWISYWFSIDSSSLFVLIHLFFRKITRIRIVPIFFLKFLYIIMKIYRERWYAIIVIEESHFIYFENQDSISMLIKKNIRYCRCNFRFILIFSWDIPILEKYRRYALIYVSSFFFFFPVTITYIWVTIRHSESWSYVVSLIWDPLSSIFRMTIWTWTCSHW